MANVLVAHADEAIRDVVETALREEAGHVVVSMASGELALSMLWQSATPMVALVDERLTPFNGVDLLRLVANDTVGGPLQRHRYVLMSTSPCYLAAKDRSVLSRLRAPVLAQPFELSALLWVVDGAGATYPAATCLTSPLWLSPLPPPSHRRTPVRAHADMGTAGLRASMALARQAASARAEAE